MKNHNRIWIPIAIAVAILFGLTMMFYPWFSAWYSDRTRSEVQVQYHEAIRSADKSVIAIAREDAHRFNEDLFSGTIDPLAPDTNGYFSQLDPLNTGIIGYVVIDKINVSLPIFHGTDDSVLSKGAGHMPQTSLPVGGINTHAVITAHNGMASSPMFTDLELLEPGDIFTLHVLGEDLTYRIESDADIQTVLPSVIDGIRVKRGEDLCTLITCIPFGVNSHRLMVTGHRVDLEGTPDETVSPPQIGDDPQEPRSVWETQYAHSLTIGLVMAVLALFLLLFLMLNRKKGKYAAKDR